MKQFSLGSKARKRKLHMEPAFRACVWYRPNQNKPSVPKCAPKVAGCVSSTNPPQLSNMAPNAGTLRVSMAYTTFCVTFWLLMMTMASAPISCRQ